VFDDAANVSTRSSQGWEGWDEYAPFYDWENAQTLGRRDVAFWRRQASAVRGPVLELGCGTGRISLPLAKAGTRLVGIDRSEPMLARAAKRALRLRAPAAGARRPRLDLVRGDIRSLPFEDGRFGMVLAPYGVLQSLLRDRDLKATLDAVSRVLRPGGVFGLDLVPDVPEWKEYGRRVQMRGRASGGAHLTLVESVTQDRRRRLTVFQQEYQVRRGRQLSVHPFTLTFRTIPIRGMLRRLNRAGFAVRAILGNYQGGAWDERADVWIILAEKV
jgi:SAM-dependent methyltransferase